MENRNIWGKKNRETGTVKQEHLKTGTEKQEHWLTGASENRKRETRNWKTGAMEIRNI